MKKIISVIAISVIVLMGLTTRPAHALEKGVLSVFGPIIGMPLGAVSGLVRGAVSKGTDHADDLSKAMGDGFWGKTIGSSLGLVGGIASGGVTGLLKGLYDGAVVGVLDPLSAESATLDGKLFEYEPYNIFEGQKKEQVQ